jgi:hypothetical protein
MDTKKDSHPDNWREKPLSERRGNQIRVTEKEMSAIIEWRRTGVFPPALCVSSDQSALKLKEEKDEIKRRYRGALSENTRYRELLDAALHISSRKPSSTLKIPCEKKTRASESVVVAVLADGHCGKYIDPETVNGLNFFDVEICRKRHGNFFSGILQYTNLIRNRTHAKNLLLLCVGDNVNGEVHGENRETNLLTATEQVDEMESLLTHGLNYLEAEGGFDRIDVVWKYGNHGRNTKKIRYDTAHRTSYEYLLGRLLAKRMESSKSIEFQLDKSYYSYVELFNNFLVRVHHGNMIGYKQGVGGVAVPANRTIMQLNQTTPVNLDVFGHFHHSICSGLFVMSGALCGFDAFAQNRVKAQYEPPNQAFFTIERRRGRQTYMPIFVDQEIQ